MQQASKTAFKKAKTKRSNVHADIISILEYINNIDDEGRYERGGEQTCVMELVSEAIDHDCEGVFLS